MSDVSLVVVEPRSGRRFVDLSEIWRYRELLYFLTWRDIKVRYKQTLLGASWAILQPLATMLAFSVFFGRVAGSTTAAVPYPLFVLTGLLPWLFFSNAVSSAGLSIVGSQGLITKVYFPRLSVPIAAVGATLVDFAISIALLIVMMIYYGVNPAPTWIALPVVLLGLLMLALGIGSLLAALTVEYRDFRHVIPFTMQFWLFVTPAIYLQAEQVLSDRTREIAMLNPLTGFIGNFRAALLGTPFDYRAFGVSMAIAVTIFLAAGFYFRRAERRFADVI